MTSFTSLIPSLVNSRTLTSRHRNQWEAIRTGALISVHKHWYVPRELWERAAWHKRRALHAFAVGKSARTAVLISRSAARMHGIWVMSTDREATEVGYRSGVAPGNHDRARDVNYRYTPLPQEVISEVMGVAVTTPLRTIIDICLYHGFLEGLIACDWALSHGITYSELLDELHKSGRRRGIKNARLAIRHASLLSESPAESLARGILIQSGFKDIVLQRKIGRFYADILVNGFLIIEVDGDVKYHDDSALAERLRGERQREKYLQNMGFWVLRFRPNELRENPAGFIREVQAALKARARNQEKLRHPA